MVGMHRMKGAAMDRDQTSRILRLIAAVDLHLRRAEGGDPARSARSEDLPPRSGAAVCFPRPLPISCAARRPVAGPSPPPLFDSRAFRSVPPTSCLNAANRHLPPTVLGCHAHSPHYWPALLPRWHVWHLSLIVLLLASLFPGRFSVSVKLHLLSALIISSLPANRWSGNLFSPKV
jgi:hypothetical protein